MKKKIILTAILVCVFVIMAAGVFKLIKARKQSEPVGVSKLSTSFYPLYYFASEIAGDKAKVINLVPSGVEPHEYEPTLREMAEMQNSRLIFLLGGGFEPWGNKVLEEMGRAKVIELGNGLFDGGDPHIWLSPRMAKEISSRIRKSLSEESPQFGGYYEERYKILEKRLDNLEMLYRQQLSNCEKKEVVVSHMAFAYLFRDLGIEQVAISGLNPEEEPSTKEIIEVARKAKEKGIDYIFAERLLSPKLAETVANEVGAKLLILDPIEGLSESDISQGKDYFMVMTDNLVNLRLALRCQ